MQKNPLPGLSRSDKVVAATLTPLSPPPSTLSEVMITSPIKVISMINVCRIINCKQFS